jgi:hypothetical protein
MDDVLEALKLLGPAFLDAWYVVDAQDRIIDYNPAFHALFPRAVARRLKSMTCREASVLGPCGGELGCLRERCTSTGPLRLDELEVQLGEEKLRLIVSAVPLPLGEGKVGSLIVLRNVTDDARVQAQYQQLIDGAQREMQELEDRIDARTRDLLAANAELNRLEREIARLKRGGL